MSEVIQLRKDLRDEKHRESRLARIEELENEIYDRAAGVVNAGLAFVEVDPHQTEPPQAWITEFGLEGAKLRLKAAQALWLPQSVVPSGFKLAAQVMVGIARGRGYRVRVTQNSLNVKISLPAPTTAEHPGATAYEVRDLEQ